MLIFCKIVCCFKWETMTYIGKTEFIVRWTMDALAGRLSIHYLKNIVLSVNEFFLHKLFNSICIDFTWFLIFQHVNSITCFKFFFLIFSLDANKCDNKISISCFCFCFHVCLASKWKLITKEEKQRNNLTPKKPTNSINGTFDK